MLRTYWLKELRTLFRDRNILLYGLLLPIFLYPTLLFGVTQARSYTQGLRDQNRPKIAVVGNTELLEFLQRRAGDKLHLQTLEGNKAKLLQDGTLDAVVAPLLGGETFRLEFDSTRGASRMAKERLDPLIRAFRREVEINAARHAGLDPLPWTGEYISHLDVADSQEQARRLLSMVLPLVLLIMCSFGATYPAVELTAGERERNTVETTYLLPATRAQIALGKSLAVSLAAFVALLVNLLAMFASAGPMLAHLDGGVLALPSLAAHSVPLILAFGALLSVVFANLFLLVGSYAKTYREAQAFVTPLQVLVMLPAMLTLLPGAHLTPTTALIPIYNAGLTFRLCLAEEVEAVPVILGLASLACFALICFRATVRRLSDTAFVLGFRDHDQLTTV